MKNFFRFLFESVFVFFLVICTIVFVKLVFFEENKTITPLDTNVPTVAENERYNFLVLGRDNASGLCDVMMLASYDMSSSSVSVVQLPRDTYLEYSNSSYRKLNGALTKLGSEEALCAFLSKSLSVPIDYYVTLDLDAVGDIVDAIGGVEVDVPHDMDYDDPAQKLSIHLKAGKHRLSGDEARQFVRYRAGYLRGDIGRMDAQKIFLASLIKEVRSGLSLVEAGNIVIGLRDDVKTNLPFDDMARLVKGAFSVPSEKISFVTLAGEEAIASASGASYYVISRPSALEIVNKYLGASARDESFDKEGLFLNEKYPEFCRIYNERAEYSVYNATEISNGEVQIAHK